MSRKRTAEKRPLPPDARYQNADLSRFINKVMLNGKKSVAEGIVYDAMVKIETETKKNPMDTFDLAIKNSTPMLQVKPRRVGGATYQIPVEIPPNRRLSLSMRWLINAARDRKGKPMAEKLASELIDASRGQGSAVKRKEDLHKMAEANKAFVHFRY
ncbi:MAG: 30S ribosomal protein S7 [Dehalococcoidia bacterium]|nr:30S ribosomal protein S7 [Dehalococcoidia bacterium]